MTTYVQLLSLTSEGRERMLKDPEMVLRVQHEVKVPGVQVLGLYGVLGQCDFVNLVEAPDDATVARFSLELGVRAGVTIVTMPAIPIGRFEEATATPLLENETSLELPQV